MMLRFSVVPVALLLLTASAFGKSDAPLSPNFDYQALWSQCNGAARRLCPSHHIEDFTDGQYDDVLGGFLEGYPESMRARMRAIVDYPKTCTKEVFGFSCEFVASLAAFRQIGLFDKFVRYSCGHWRCEELSLCDRIK